MLGPQGGENKATFPRRTPGSLCRHLCLHSFPPETRCSFQARQDLSPRKLEAKGRGPPPGFSPRRGTPALPPPPGAPVHQGCASPKERPPPPAHGSPGTATEAAKSWRSRLVPGSPAAAHVRKPSPLPNGLSGKPGEAVSGFSKFLQAASTARNPFKTARWPADAISPRDAKTAGES